jgi:hypothetical protein
MSSKEQNLIRDIRRATADVHVAKLRENSSPSRAELNQAREAVDRYTKSVKQMKK